MTVRELIGILNTCDENANVVIEQWDSDIFGIKEVNDLGKKYAIEKAKDQIWSGLGFVLQWAINGLKKK